MSHGSRTLTRVLVGTTSVLAAVAIAFAWDGPVGHAFWFWVVACLVGEALWLRLPVGNATLSMGSCFNLAALLVLPLHEAMIATAFASFAVELAVMRKPPIRAVYNAGHTALAVGGAALAFRFLAGGETDLVALVTGVKLLPFVAAALVYYAINRAAVSMVVAIHEGLPALLAWRRNFGNGYELLSTGAVFSLGILLAVHYQGIGMAGTLLVVLPLVLACDGYRRFTERRPARAEEAPAEPDHRDAA